MKCRQPADRPEQVLSEPPAADINIFFFSIPKTDAIKEPVHAPVPGIVLSLIFLLTEIYINL